MRFPRSLSWRLNQAYIRGLGRFKNVYKGSRVRAYVHTHVCTKVRKLRISFVYEKILPPNSRLVSGPLLPFPPLDLSVIIFQDTLEIFASREKITSISRFLDSFTPFSLCTVIFQNILEISASREKTASRFAKFVQLAFSRFFHSFLSVYYYFSKYLGNSCCYHLSKYFRKFWWYHLSKYFGNFC